MPIEEVDLSKWEDDGGSYLRDVDQDNDPVSDEKADSDSGP